MKKVLVLVMVIVLTLCMSGCQIKYIEEKVNEIVDEAVQKAVTDAEIAAEKGFEEEIEKVNDELSSDNMPLAENGRELRKTIEYFPEGMVEYANAELHIGDGYSFYMLSDEYNYNKDKSGSVTEEEWVSDYGTCRFRVNTYENTDDEAAIKLFEKEHDEFKLEFDEKLSFGGEGKKSDSSYNGSFYMVGDVHSYDKNVYIISVEFPYEGWDGIGMLAVEVLRSFHIEY